MFAVVQSPPATARSVRPVSATLSTCLKRPAIRWQRVLSEIPVKAPSLILPLLFAALAFWPHSSAHALQVWEVQGNGLTSPFVGQNVSIDPAIVTAVLNGGFFVQTPNEHADGPEALTSNGIRVLTAGAPQYPIGGAIQVGDRVSLQGTVLEQDRETRLQMTGATRIAVGQALPTATELSFEVQRPRPVPSNLFCFENLSNFECFEGMRVTLPDAMVVAGNELGASNNYGPVYVSPYARRSLREKGVRPDDLLVEGQNEQAGYWDGNPEILRMEFDRFGALASNTPLVGGTRFSAAGILTVVNGAYTFWPTAITIDAPTNTLPVSTGVAETATSFRIGTLDLGGLCSTPACSSALGDGSEAGRLAAYIVGALGSPEVLAVQQVETQAALNQLASAASAASGLPYTGLLGGGGDGNGLKLGFLIRSDKISTIGHTTLLAGVTFGGLTLHPLPPVLFEGSFNDGSATHLFRVLNVHIDPRAGIENNPTLRERRFQQALSLANLIQATQTDGNEVDKPLTVVGKLHGWTRADGYVDVHGMLIGRYFDPENLRNLDDPNAGNPVSPVLTSIMVQLADEAQVSTMTRESFGAVYGESNRVIPAAVAFDHILLSHDARRTTTEFGVARGNADAPEFLALAGSGAVGSSAFDGLVVRIYPGCLNDSSTNQDGDNWCDLFDNCPTVANDDQTDTNGNGVGDACAPEGDLALALSASPNPAEPGQSVTVTATVSHTSGLAVQDPTLTLELPRRFALQSVNAGSWSCDPIAPGTVSATLSCSLAQLGSGSASVSVVGIPDADLPPDALLQVSGVVAPADIWPNNNSATLEIGISGTVTDLRLLIENPPLLTEIGAELDFRLILNNLGQRAADDVVVQMNRPVGTEFIAIDGTGQWNCNPAGASTNALDCTRASYAAGSQSDILFTLRVLPSVPATFTVNPSISSSTPDPDPSNNSVTLVFTVTDPQDVIFANGFEN